MDIPPVQARADCSRCTWILVCLAISAIFALAHLPGKRYRRTGAIYPMPRIWATPHRRSSPPRLRVCLDLALSRVYK
jgi:hypothetical protein